MRIRFLLSFLLISALLTPSVAHAQKDKSLWEPNPNPSKYFLGPSAIPMEKRTGYYQNSYVLFNEAYYGVTDWFSMGVGFEFISTFVTLANPPWRPIVLVNPKIGFKVADKLYASVSGLYVNVMPANDKDTPEQEGTFGVVMGQITYGSVENNVTAGVAWGYSWDSMAEKPLITLGGSWRVGKRLSLMTENYFVPTDDGLYPLFMYGMRFIGQKMSFDLGFIDNADLAKVDIVGIPFVSMTFNF